MLKVCMYYLNLINKRNYMTVKRTDDWLKKSTDDYKALVQSKDARNQLIIQAHNARGIRNYSTIEQEKYNSIDRIVQQQEQEIIKRESSIIDEKQKIMIKLKEDLKNSQLKQIEECRNKRLQEKNYNKTVEDQLINRSINDYQEYQIKSKLEKFQKQQQMKQELEVLMRLRKEQAQENKLLLNPIEFSMNKRSLKELGIENFHDQYEEVLSPGQIQQF
ncbi:UNKNOWN [Stylonychia lemnae]|uniref:Uncharacterized protein n=1 Tax=Stylonychia lemnae TaxID=5949 RepID=A0A078ASS0_STYLE|nr:UNKNOWN [Stylonychia lemnae]|eukprot:CDW84257.1 UNKNOWN [Stylonychia lemnae]